LHRVAGHLPPAQLTRIVDLRPVASGDREFLYRLYTSTRTDELAVVPWNGAQKAAFLRMQFDAQDAWYREQYPQASFDVVRVNGESAGRLYVDRREDEVRIVDIALMPEHRGRGIGTALLERILDEADEARTSVTIHVERGNRARELYERLGFVEVAENGVYALLERQPRAS
jgi:ribosomal protein S18 acetylase RimI-like enzyme